MDGLLRLARAAARGTRVLSRAPTADRLSRRALLVGGALAAQSLTSSPAHAGGPRTAIEALLDRTSHGPTPAERTLAQTLGYQPYLESQLAFESVADTVLAARLAVIPILAMAPHQLAAVDPSEAFAQILEATFLRAILSRRHLYERMVEFWSDHFNVSIYSGVQLRALYDRDTIRPHALSKFRDLLFATAQSPAMIEYLDNNLNHVNDPNENYARELMELHTIGVDGGYTQQDVREIARCFTGWSYYSAFVQPAENRLLFNFNPIEHDFGQKVVLGNLIPAGGGLIDGYMVLDILANHPSTARRIAEKMCAWFWGEEPPVAMVNAVTATYQSTDGDIKEMIRTIFSQSDFTAAPAKYKRPFHAFISGLRQTGATVTTTNGLRGYISQTGHLPFGWTPPNGYPDTFAHWSGMLLPRWNFATMYCCEGISGLALPVTTFLLGATTPALALDRIDQELFGGRMPLGEKQEILNFASTGYFGFDDLRKRETVALALASPAFQWF